VIVNSPDEEPARRVRVYDSTREASDAFVLDDSDAVAAWVGGGRGVR
jgi:hypothetical protein